MEVRNLELSAVGRELDIAAARVGAQQVGDAGSAAALDSGTSECLEKGYKVGGLGCYGSRGEYRGRPEALESDSDSKTEDSA